MKKRMMQGASLVIGALLVAMVFAGVNPVRGAEPLPFTRFGDDPTNDTTPSTLITAWVDGVEYSWNTSLSSGFYSIDVQGDDTTDSPNVKDGGLNNDPVQYVLGGRLTTASPGSFAAQTDTWLSNVTVEGPLSAGPQPEHLKINNVSSQSTITGGPTDYIVIYNPDIVAGIDDVTAYYLAVGTAPALQIIATDIYTTQMYDWITNPIPANDFIVIDMTKWGGLSNTGNSIKLIYNNATGFIVDRVEYGAIATSPENTILNNSAAPAAGQEIARRTWPGLVFTPGEDTNDCGHDFGTRTNWLPKDTVAPTSTVTAVAAWYNTFPQTVGATASDTGGAGVANVTLEYSYEWGAWTFFGTDFTFPYQWSFPFPSGVGYYDLRSYAIDNAGNIEAVGVADTWIGFDTILPTVNAGSDETRNALFNSVTGRATPASAVDNPLGTETPSNNLTYQWQASGPGIVTFSAPTALNTDISASADGTYTIWLNVTDAAGNTASDFFILVWDTTGPTVNAGSDETVNFVIWTTAAYRATPASASDALTGISNYTWSMTAGPGVITWSAQWALNTSVTPSVDGTYTLRLTVTDGAGNTAFDEFILVYDTGAPTVNAGSDETVNFVIWTTAAYRATPASASDTLTGISNYTWSMTAGPGVITWSAQWSLNTSVTPSVDGTYTLRLTVTDGAGNTAFDEFILVYDTGAPTV
ncbi:MAG: Ig-like domain repeat protein, partial [Candidatus Thermoplasmatota archaeon]